MLIIYAQNNTYSHSVNNLYEIIFIQNQYRLDQLN